MVGVLTNFKKMYLVSNIPDTTPPNFPNVINTSSLPTTTPSTPITEQNVQNNNPQLYKSGITPLNQDLPSLNISQLGDVVTDHHQPSSNTIEDSAKPFRDIGKIAHITSPNYPNVEMTHDTATPNGSNVEKEDVKQDPVSNQPRTYQPYFASDNSITSSVDRDAGAANDDNAPKSSTKNSTLSLRKNSIQKYKTGSSKRPLNSDNENYLPPKKKIKLDIIEGGSKGTKKVTMDFVPDSDVSLIRDSIKKKSEKKKKNMFQDDKNKNDSVCKICNLTFKGVKLLKEHIEKNHRKHLPSHNSAKYWKKSSIQKYKKRSGSRQVLKPHILKQ